MSDLADYLDKQADHDASMEGYGEVTHTPRLLWEAAARIRELEAEVLREQKATCDHMGVVERLDATIEKVRAMAEQYPNQYVGILDILDRGGG